MGTNEVTQGPVVTRLAAIDADEKAARDDKARHNLAVMALDRPDSHAWLAEMLDALGLRGRVRPAVSPRKVARDIDRPKGELKHGTKTGYVRHGCRCDLCCDAGETR